MTREFANGDRVVYVAHDGAQPEHGKIQGLAKLLGANGAPSTNFVFVLFDGDKAAKATPIDRLTREVKP